MLPQFLALGPQRTGSTWLYECLSKMPGVFVPTRVKETFFFDVNFDRGVSWYERYFENCPDGWLAGEVGPTYFADFAAAQRIHAVVPDAKMIVQLRDPAERAWSMFRFFHSKGDFPADFHAAVRKMPRILHDGLYAQHLLRLRDVCAGQPLLVLTHEMVAASPDAALADVCKFLGLPGIDAPVHDGEKINASGSARSRFASALATRSVRALHRAGLHGVVDAGKKLGAKRMLYKSAAALPELPPPAILRELQDFYRADGEALLAMKGRDFRVPWLEP